MKRNETPTMSKIRSKQSSYNEKAKLVLDLDETLVHSTPRRSTSHESSHDFVVDVCVHSKRVPFYVKCRPYLSAFLRHMAKLYEITVFTASRRAYADQILDRIDPHGETVSRRFYRRDCSLTMNGFGKNLSRVCRSRLRLVQIDDTPSCIVPDNGILISKWTNDPNDTALRDLVPLLEILACIDDVRPILSRRTISSG